MNPVFVILYLGVAAYAGWHFSRVYHKRRKLEREKELKHRWEDPYR